MIRVLSWIVMLLLTINGCRDANLPELVPVGGTVTLDREPLSGGLVQFLPLGWPSPNLCTSLNERIWG